jgi:hypothetical protein
LDMGEEVGGRFFVTDRRTWGKILIETGVVNTVCLAGGGRWRETDGDATTASTSSYDRPVGNVWTEDVSIVGFAIVAEGGEGGRERRVERIEECAGDVDAKVGADQEMQLWGEGDGEGEVGAVGDGGVYGGEDGVSEGGAGSAKGGHGGGGGRGRFGGYLFRWGTARSTEGRIRQWMFLIDHRGVWE